MEKKSKPIPIKINPAACNKHHAKLLYQLFQQHQQLRFNSNPKKFYSVRLPPNNIEYQIFLTHNIVRRTRKTSRQRYGKIDNYVWDVLYLDQIIGKGSFGTIFRIGTLTLDRNEKVKFKSNVKKPLVLKFQTHSDNRKLSWLQAEYEFMQLTPHLGVKPFTVIKNSLAVDESYLVMHLQNGRSLHDIIIDDRNNIRPLTIEQRFTISINLFYALFAQVHGLGMVHRDIKPDNIIVDLNTGAIYIIDYGLSKYSTVIDNSFVGNEKYAAPEVHRKLNATYKSDIYAIGLIISELWGVPARSGDFFNASQKKHSLAQLGQNCVGLAKVYEIELKRVLEMLLNLDAQKRLTISTAAHELEKIQLDYILSQRPADVSAQALVDTYNLAKLVNYKIKSLTNHIAIKNVIINALMSLDKSDYAFKIFTDIVNIPWIKLMPNASAIMQLLNHDVTQFETNNLQLSQLDLTIEKAKILLTRSLGNDHLINKLSFLIDDIRLFRYKYNKTGLTRFVNLNNLNQRFNLEIAEFKKRWEKIQSQPAVIYTLLLNNLKQASPTSLLTQHKILILDVLKDCFHTAKKKTGLYHSPTQANQSQVAKDILLLVRDTTNDEFLLHRIKQQLKTIPVGYFGRNKFKESVQLVLDQCHHDLRAKRSSPGPCQGKLRPGST